MCNTGVVYILLHLCAAYMCAYTCMCEPLCMLVGLTDVEQRILAFKVLRLNTSELYQHFNAASILQQLVDEKIVPPQFKEMAILYAEKYAKNMAAFSAMFSSGLESPQTLLLSLCDKFEATGTPEQQCLATKLRSRKYYISSLYSIYYLQEFNFRVRTSHVHLNEKSWSTNPS